MANAPGLKSPLRLAVMISATGRALRDLMRKIDSGRLNAEIRMVLASTPSARGLQYAEIGGLPIHVVQRKNSPSREAYSRAIFERCRAAEVDLVALAGFVKRLVIPNDFENRVVNTHPALAPAFCGEGFYGDHVHEAVLEYGVKLSGCTVHYVDNEYERGPVILQQVVPVCDDDTLATLEARVFAAECESYADALELIAAGRVEVAGRHVHILQA